MNPALAANDFADGLQLQIPARWNRSGSFALGEPLKNLLSGGETMVNQPTHAQ